MCKFCEAYDFDRIGCKFPKPWGTPFIYFVSTVSKVSASDRFKYCPICGANLKEVKERKEREEYEKEEENWKD